MISLITPTRDRPEAFTFCVQWMSRQTYQGAVQWIIVDDGDAPVNRDLWKNWPLPAWQIFYKRRKPCDAANTLPQNMTAALPLVTGEKILIIEDDEYYSPRYIEEMSSQLDQVDLFGEGPARYYNVVDRHWRLPKEPAKHASFCRTGIRSKLLPHLHNAVEMAGSCGDPWIDLRLWGLRELWIPEGTTKKILPDLILSIGIKGLPGRGGLGTQHRPGLFPYMDYDMAELTKWIGEDAKAYARFFQGERTADSMVR